MMEYFDIASKWIRLQHEPMESDTYSELIKDTGFFFFSALNSPRVCFDICVAILAIDTSDWICANLGAGPLEDMVSAHGMEAVMLIKEGLPACPALANAARNIWKSDIPDDVWTALQDVIG